MGRLLCFAAVVSFSSSFFSSPILSDRRLDACSWSNDADHDSSARLSLASISMQRWVCMTHHGWSVKSRTALNYTVFSYVLCGKLCRSGSFFQYILLLHPSTFFKTRRTNVPNCAISCSFCDSFLFWNATSWASSDPSTSSTLTTQWNGACTSWSKWLKDAIVCAGTLSTLSNHRHYRQTVPSVIICWVTRVIFVKCLKALRSFFAFKTTRTIHFSPVQRLTK